MSVNAFMYLCEKMPKKQFDKLVIKVNDINYKGGMKLAGDANGFTVDKFIKGSGTIILVDGVQIVKEKQDQCQTCKHIGHPKEFGDDGICPNCKSKDIQPYEFKDER